MEKEQLIAKYNSVNTVFPFPQNEKYIFAYVMRELYEDYKDNILCLSVESNDFDPVEVFTKLSTNNVVKYFSYNFLLACDKPRTHVVQVFVTDPDFLLACKLLDKEDVILKALVK